MLGVRLDPETERGLNAIAERTGQSKSRIAREAIRAFVVRNDRDALASEEWRRISRTERGDPEITEILSAGTTDFGGPE